MNIWLTCCSNTLLLLNDVALMSFTKLSLPALSDCVKQNNINGGHALDKTEV